MDFKTRVSQEQRITILQALAEDTDYRINDAMLQTFLGALAMDVSLDKLRNQLAWLEEMELVTVEKVSTMHIAKLTQRGLDVAKGRSGCDGVAKPSVGSV